MLRKILIAVLAIIVLLLIGAYFFVQSLIKSPQPDYNQNINLPGLNDKVTVIRDKWGMPHIYAENLDDLYRVLGYVMAQDRLWHMDLIRRATQGRLSEIFGKDFVQTDLLLRSLRISDKSEYLYKVIPDTLRNYLIAFSEGVNYFIHNTKKLPLEFKILKYEPEDWTPQNTLNLIGFMAWDLTSGWREDIMLWQIAQKVDSVKFSEIVPDFTGFPVIYKDFKLQGEPTVDLGKVAAQLENLNVIARTGSNNWAVDPEKSALGKPILANDMHLGFGIPGIWYQVHLIVPGKLNVTGVTIPGAPGIVAGHNNNIAWGMTNVMLDDMDFYVEKINDDTTEYLVDGQWRPFKIYTERIITKEGDTVTKKLLFTHRGPVVSGFKDIKGQVLSAAWGGYDSLSNELMGVFMLNFAKNWDDFRKATQHFRSVAQNIIYADVQGNIGLQLSAGIPIRKGPAYLPFDGQTTEHDWKGWVPFDELPYEFNPQRHWVASANNKSAENYPYYISAYYAPGSRYNRIVEMITEKEKLSTDDFKKMHTDWHSWLAKKTLPVINQSLQKLQTQDQLVQQAIEKLKTWDGNVVPDKVAPLLYEEFYYQFMQAVLADELGYKLFRQVVANKMISGRFFLRLMDEPNSPWFDDITTKDKENFDQIVNLAFVRSVDTLKNLLGNDIENWKYGDFHTLTLEHPLGKVKLLDKLFRLNRGPYKIGGSWHTVSPYAYRFGDHFAVYHGASQRHIFVVGDWDKGWMIIPTGNSGLPGNEFYCNQTGDYLKGIYRPDAFSDSAVQSVKKYERYFFPAQ